MPNRPTETFCPACGVVFFQDKPVIFRLIILLVVLYLLKTKACRALNCFEAARGPKKLPTPAKITKKYKNLIGLDPDDDVIEEYSCHVLVFTARDHTWSVPRERETSLIDIFVHFL